MKKASFTLCLFLYIFIITSVNSYAQRNEWVNQVITVNSGKFETVPPYTDYVTVQTYNPVSHQSNIFDVIHTQSAQDVVVSGDFAYVAASDSIIMYNINNHQRVAAKVDSGISKLFIYNNRLVISKQWPIKRFFVEVLDASNLSLIARVQNISGDCSGITADGDTVYVAVPGGFGSTVGKIAVISTSPWSCVREINLGEQAVGIRNLYNYNGHIFSVNRTVDGVTPLGSISRYTLYTYTFINKMFDVILGDGVGLYNGLLYLNMNNGIGTLDLASMNIQDTAVVPDPGFAKRIFITSAGIEYVNGDIYMNIGNRISYGLCVQYTYSGDSTTSYTTGINSDALAFDYRSPVSIENGIRKVNMTIYPNPVQEYLWINISEDITVNGVKIFDPMGQAIPVKKSSEYNGCKIQCADLHPGIYFLTVQTSQGSVTQKFIKK